jgi:hypothetical protein
LLQLLAGFLFMSAMNHILSVFMPMEHISLMALPAKWWKDPCSNFPDGIGWQS